MRYQLRYVRTPRAYPVTDENSSRAADRMPNRAPVPASPELSGFRLSQAGSTGFGDRPYPFRSDTVTDVTRRAAEIRLDALLRTACDVIGQRGLANTRTADVAQAAGVSQALVFYHFATKERLLAQAFAYAVEQDLARLDAVTRSSAPPLTKLRRILRLYTPAGRATSWSMWIDGWAESLRTPELEKVSRKLDLRWRQDLATVIADGVREGSFVCADRPGPPGGSAP